MTLPPKSSYQLGLISDTHGYFPANVLHVFRGVDAILHAGDIGSGEVLSTLSQIAPIVAVRGNMDWGLWADRLSEKQSIRVGERVIHLIHDVARLRLDLLSPPWPILVHGHTHRPSVETKNGVFYVNPGSAGAPRYGECAGVALLRISGLNASADLICLQECSV
jgi:putative phosphoesterase